MAFKTVNDLTRAILRLGLVEAVRLNSAVAELAPGEQGPDALLQVLQNDGLLTPFQVAHLEKGETEGLVLGEYKLLYRNASGSFARVFRACSVRDGRMIGVKVLRQRWVSDPKVVAQFHREAELCLKLRHKNIVPIYEVATQGEYHYFTMEFVEGGNLRELVKIRTKLSPVEAARCARDMAEGLEYALQQGITHRDLKMTNVLMSAQGVAKLVDFGLAGVEGPASGSGAGDSVQRALEYAALEKGTSAPANDPRSDLFFLGAIFYELLTGSPPWTRTRDRQQRAQLARYTNIRPIRTLDPNVPKVLVEIVERLMKIRPDQRYQSPSELVVELRRVLTILESEGGEAAEAAARLDRLGGKPEKQLPTVMCIEDRVAQQDHLRQYFSKHGFRVLVLADVTRGLGRLGNDSPDAVVLMGGSLGAGVVGAYQEAMRRGREESVVVVAVLPEKLADLREQMEETSRSRVLVQPVKLRALREALLEGIEKRGEDSREINVSAAT